MLRRIIVVLLLILISAAVTSLVSGGSALVAGNFEDGGATQIFMILSIVAFLISAIVFCLLVLAMAVYLVEQSNKNASQAESGSPTEK